MTKSNSSSADVNKDDEDIVGQGGSPPQRLRLMEVWEQSNTITKSRTEFL